MLLLGCLTAAAAAALGWIVLAPTPLPAALSPLPGAHTIPGYRIVPAGGLPAAAGRRLARSALLHYRVLPLSGGPPLALTLVNLHSRSHSSFQLAALTRGPDAPAGLALRQRRLLGLGPPMPATLAAGRLSGGEAAWQSCLVASAGSSRGGVTQKQLTELQRPTAQTPGFRPFFINPRRDAAVAEELAQLVGLRANVRWQCLLVSASTAAGPGSRERLQRFWQAAALPLAVWAR